MMRDGFCDARLSMGIQILWCFFMEGIVQAASVLEKTDFFGQVG